MAKVIIYTTPVCAYCQMAKDFFVKNNVAYEEKNVASDAQAREEMIQKSSQLGVPVIDIDGSVVVGFNKVKLAQLLGLS